MGRIALGLVRLILLPTAPMAMVVFIALGLIGLIAFFSSIILRWGGVKLGLSSTESFRSLTGFEELTCDLTGQSLGAVGWVVRQEVAPALRNLFDLAVVLSFFGGIVVCIIGVPLIHYLGCFFYGPAEYVVKRAETF